MCLVSEGFPSGIAAERLTSVGLARWLFGFHLSDNNRQSSYDVSVGPVTSPLSLNPPPKDQMEKPMRLSFWILYKYSVDDVPPPPT